MKKNELFEAYQTMFPFDAAKVMKVKKIGSCTIRLTFCDREEPLLFMYMSPENWSYGTRIWRQRPRDMPATPSGMKEILIKDLKEELKDEER